MGLSVDDDIDRLQPGELIRFCSDADVGCFPDAGAWTALTAPFRTYANGVPAPRHSERLPGGCERVTDESQQADLATFTAQSVRGRAPTRPRRDRKDWPSRSRRGGEGRPPG
jgi:hypothetical protein